MPSTLYLRCGLVRALALGLGLLAASMAAPGAAPGEPPGAPADAAPSPYPATAVKPVTDAYFGVSVQDPYRWLENAADPQVQAWSQAQNAHARAYLDAVPARAALKRRLTSLITAASPRFFSLRASGDRLFALYDDPHFQQPQLVVMGTDADPARRRVVLDPNALDSAGHTAIDWYVPSHDGRLVAVSMSKNGSEDGSLQVFEVATGKSLGQPIPRVQYPTAGGSLAWAADNRSFWYTRYPGTERPEADRHFFMQVYFHHLGEDWTGDRLVLGTADGVPRTGEILLDNRHAPDRVLASVELGDGGQWSHWLIAADGKKVHLDRFDDKVVAATLAPDGGLVLVSTSGAPRGKVLRLPPGMTDLARATTLVPEGKDAIVIRDSDGALAPTLTATAMLINTIDGGPNHVRIYGLDGKPAPRYGGGLPLQDIASFSNLEPLPDGDVLIGVSGYLRPFYYVRWHPATGDLEETKIVVQSPMKFDDTEVVRAFATSRDGTRVPLNILRRKGARLDGAMPTLLYGYGGFGSSQQPHFAGPMARLWLDVGGVYVVANTRGGAEYGERWHDEGRLLKKQNVFDDFTAAAEYLVKSRYTDPAHLALMGGSNGGLLMGAVLTQHPQLARAVVSSVGIYDMLRVELDPNGAFNTAEFGSVTDPAQFKALYAYSPYHHVQAGAKYPALLLTTGANDGRVNPLQSRKFCAAMQAATASGLPVLLSTSSTSGHGIGSALSERIDQNADMLGFLFDQLEMANP
jgi:prolyl oligopeptidase